MFQLRRNRVLVVLVLMSIFVVTTQAFSVTSEPVIVDWQYDPWGDSGLVIVTDSEVYTQVVANQVTFSFTLRNDGSNTETATVRVELVDSSGDRVAVTGQSNTNPDDDTQWLVATEQTTSAMAPTNTWGSADFTFNDAKVDSTISGGGYFVIYASTGTDMASYDIVPIERTPVLDEWGDGEGEVWPSASHVVTAGSWLNPAFAYDGNNATWAEEDEVQVVNHIWFESWDSTDHGTISQVDVHIYMNITGLSNDVITFLVYLSDGQPTPTYTPTTPTLDITSANGGSPVHFVLTNVVEPGDGVWTWTEIGLLSVRLEGVKNAGPDPINDYAVAECWAKITIVL